MQKVSHGSLLRFGVVCIVYWLVPLLGHPGFGDGNLGKTLVVLALVFGFPLLTFVMAFWDGLVTGFHWQWILVWFVAPMVFFLSTVFVFYNSSALFYCAFYGSAALFGNGLGMWFRHIDAKGSV